VRSDVTSGLRSIPGIGAHAGQVASALVQGNSPLTAAHGAPPAVLAQIGLVAHTSFTSGLNEILVIGGILVLASSVLCFFLIRSQDFAHGSAEAGARAAAAA